MDAPQLREEGTPQALALLAAIQSATSEVFDLGAGPLFRVNLFKVCPALRCDHSCDQFGVCVQPMQCSGRILQLMQAGYEG